MRKLFLLLSLVLTSACTLSVAKPVVTPPVLCTTAACTSAQLNLSVTNATPATVATLTPDSFNALAGLQTSPGRFSFIVPGNYSGGATITITTPSFLPFSQRLFLSQADGSCKEEPLPTSGAWEICPVITLKPSFPNPPTRAQILGAHESFQGAVLHTSQFGDLNWWPTAWDSLNAQDQQASFAQISSWGDTEITLSSIWDYGEAGQPYGSGQLVPPANFMSHLQDYRQLAKNIIQAGFIPEYYLQGDNGFDQYMANMPLVVAALLPQPGDPLDLTQYGGFLICYDSCIPGYQPPTQVDQAILALRALVPNGVIKIEQASGYASWCGDGCGASDFQSPAGMALDEWDIEFPLWPTTGDQVWQILGRDLGPAYIRDPLQPAGDDPNPPFYMSQPTPRGPRQVRCKEYGTYTWVRGQITAQAVTTARAYYSSLGCPVVD